MEITFKNIGNYIDLKNRLRTEQRDLRHMEQNEIGYGSKETREKLINYTRIEIDNLKEELKKYD